ncbi:MAG TPA: hypothetical protein VHE30_10340 [Polyangiaceae bacterium]|nr:hypothetical protein [Polyangiaceae bacterium]
MRPSSFRLLLGVFPLLFLGAPACSGSVFSAGTPEGSGGSAGEGGGGASGGSADGGASGASGHASSGGSAGHGSGGSGGRDGQAGSGDGGLVGSSGGADHGGGTSSGGASAGGSNGAGGNPDTGGASPVDAGPKPLTSCPKDPPDGNAECRGKFTCTYGDDPRPKCREAYQCDGAHFLVSVSVCTKLEACYTDVSPLPVIGQPCQNVNEFCIWDSGLACSCTPCANGSCSSGLTWSCAPAPSDPCPVNLPNLGQACESNAATSCKYAGCPVESAAVATCTNGAWQWDVPVCN